MNLQSLYYFCIAAEELNFTRAAHRLYISQQALSSQISKLEEHYQVPLFDRGNPMTLTDAGRVLYQSALSVLDTMRECDRQLQDLKDYTNGSLKVGAGVSRGSIMFPPLCAAFRKVFPRIQLELLETANTAAVEDALCSGEIDLMLGYLPVNPGNIISEPLYTEKFMLVVPEELLDTLPEAEALRADAAKPRSLAEFAALPFVSQSTDTKGGVLFREICAEAGVEPKVVLSTRNVTTLLNLSLAGLGASLVPLTFVRELRASAQSPTAQKGTQTVRVFPLASRIGESTININYLRSKTLTVAGRELIRIAKELFAE